MTINADTIIAICTAIALFASLGSWYITERRQRPAREAERQKRVEAEVEKSRMGALMYDEIVGHSNVPGVPDKEPMSVRLARLEIGVSGMQRELHPNGGSSLADDVNATMRIAGQALEANLQNQQARMEALAKESLIRAYVIQHPEQFPELYRLVQMLPPASDKP